MNLQNYFPHDAFMRNKSDSIRLRIQLGVVGYGIYMMLLERLCETDSFRCSLDLEAFSQDFGCEKTLIRSVLFDFDLFTFVNGFSAVESVELNASMNLMDDKKRRRIISARAAQDEEWKKESHISRTDVSKMASTDVIVSLYCN